MERAQPGLADYARPIFVSRAGEDEALSERIVDILEAAGYREVIVQQRDFQQRNFLDCMNEALERNARVVALLSDDYLRKDNCKAEWMNALAGDALNKKGRVVALRIAECNPRGLLAGIPYTDLVPYLHDHDKFAQLVVRALEERPRRESSAEQPAAPEVLGAAVDPEMIAAATTFTGRGDELVSIEGALWRGPGIAVVYGLGGMGKSTLAREYAWRNRARYSAVAWLSAETETGIIEGLLRTGRHFFRDLDRVTDRRMAAKSVVSADLERDGRPLLLVFDNLPDPPLLHAWRPSGGAHVIVTTRHAAWPRRVPTIALSAWSPDEAIRYLQDESGRVDLGDEDARTLVDALGALPLAVASAAAYLRETRTVTVQSYLARIRHHLATAPPGTEYPRAVFATFQEAIETCEDESPGSASIACLAAYFAPDAIPEELFQHAIGTEDALCPRLTRNTAPAELKVVLNEPVKVEEALGALDRRSLITFSSGTRSFSMHRLVQATARDMVAERSAAWARAAVTAADRVFPSHVNYTVWPVCERLLLHARAALDALPENDLAAAGHLANQCAIYLTDRGDYAGSEHLQRRSLAIAETVYGPHHNEVAINLSNLADWLLVSQPDEAEALLRRAITIRENNDDPEAQLVTVLTKLGETLIRKEQYDEAETTLDRALDAASDGSNPVKLARILIGRGRVYHATDRDDEARADFERAAEIFEGQLEPNDPELAVLLISLSLLAEPEEAERLLGRAVAIGETTFGPNHPEVSIALVHLALLLVRTGRVDEAERLLRRAVQINCEFFDRRHPSRIDTVRQLATLLQAQGRDAEAEALLQSVDLPN